MEETKITTKQDEKNALAKIKKIVEGLGENSYVATAFDGAFELAEKNIADDAAYSVKEITEKRNLLIDEFNNLKKELDRVGAEARQQKEARDHWYDEYEAEKERVNKMRDERDEQAIARYRAESTLAEAQAENIKLKARLYDLLIAEKEDKASV